MFETLSMAPPDAILGLTEAFKKDPNPKKINLGVGVYKDESGQTPIFATVKKAEKTLLEKETTKSYLPIEGAPEYGKLVQELVLGARSAIAAAGRAATAHTPGGTGALRVAADFLKKFAPNATVWASDETWPNHPQIFNAAGFKVAKYPYYNAETKSFEFEKMLEALGRIPKGDVLLLQGTCHNPTGLDPTPEQWTRIAQAAARQGVTPLVDFAYQGLAKGLEEDAAGVRAVCEACPEVLVASSFSKNFGLYNERVGALTLVGTGNDGIAKAMSHLKIAVRTNYSNPAAHGGAVVVTILSDQALRAEWEAEVAAIRNRIRQMRTLFVDTLKAKGVKRDFSFIAQQNGMFSYSGLSKEQVQALRDKHAIYIVANGRMNVAGMTRSNMDALCQAIAEVLAG